MSISKIEDNGLPRGWVKILFRDLINPRAERVSPLQYQNLPYIGLENVEAHTMKLLGNMPSISMKSSSAHFYPKDVLYSRLRPYLNKVVCLDFEGLASAEFIVFPDTPYLNSFFLKYRLNSFDFVNFTSHLNAGDRPRVDFEMIGAFELIIPPLNEQKRIVDKIEELFSKLDAGIAALERVQANLKRYRAAVLKAAVEGKLTEEWRKQNPNTEPASKLSRFSRR